MIRPAIDVRAARDQIPHLQFREYSGGVYQSRISLNPHVPRIQATCGSGEYRRFRKACGEPEVRMWKVCEGLEMCIYAEDPSQEAQLFAPCGYLILLIFRPR